MNSTLVFFIILCITSIGFSLADNHNLQDACPTDMTAKEAVFINGFPCKNPSSIAAADFKTSNLKQEGDTDNFLLSSQNPGVVSISGAIFETDKEFKDRITRRLISAGATNMSNLSKIHIQ
ncbi:hypothetical protein F3Y22_tig00109906pilonHSYRG00041 [Hibiscus syriacus]|uniref:Uncharacterized protein n=1 Tax=Hibiscus syriacus TaxID=106335 RepID=A0A6A3BTG8_HIBSY|nr:hypothetical protein F3Y22_tig00109906pilonHSYRG00041 [Hibiscus syriacus]